MIAFFIDCLVTAFKAALGAYLAMLILITFFSLWHFCQGCGAAIAAEKKSRTRQP